VLAFRFLIDFPSVWGGRIPAGMLDLCCASFAGLLFALFVWFGRGGLVEKLVLANLCPFMIPLPLFLISRNLGMLF
jgi:hypothetical protein